MQKFLVLSALLLMKSTVLNAQSAQQIPLAATINPNASAPVASDWNFKLTQADLDLISEGLQSQPFGKVVVLVNKLRQQWQEQQPKLVAPTAPDVPKADGK